MHLMLEPRLKHLKPASGGGNVRDTGLLTAGVTSLSDAVVDDIDNVVVVAVVVGVDVKDVDVETITVVVDISGALDDSDDVNVVVTSGAGFKDKIDTDAVVEASVTANLAASNGFGFCEDTAEVTGSDGDVFLILYFNSDVDNDLAFGDATLTV